MLVLEARATCREFLTSHRSSLTNPNLPPCVPLHPIFSLIIVIKSPNPTFNSITVPPSNILLATTAPSKNNAISSALLGPERQMGETTRPWTVQIPPRVSKWITPITPREWLETFSMVSRRLGCFGPLKLWGAGGGERWKGGGVEERSDELVRGFYAVAKVCRLPKSS